MFMHLFGWIACNWIRLSTSWGLFCGRACLFVILVLARTVCVVLARNSGLFYITEISVSLLFVRFKQFLFLFSSSGVVLCVLAHIFRGIYSCHGSRAPHWTFCLSQLWCFSNWSALYPPRWGAPLSGLLRGKICQHLRAVQGEDWLWLQGKCTDSWASMVRYCNHVKFNYFSVTPWFSLLIFFACRHVFLVPSGESIYPTSRSPFFLLIYICDRFIRTSLNSWCV